jgi:hypothetical protein
MKCNVLINSTATASRTILGVEIADSLQAATDLTTRPTPTVGGVSCVYKLVEVSSSVDNFLNNYNQYYFSGTSVYASAGYDATKNRGLADTDIDMTIPYASDTLHTLL